MLYFEPWKKALIAIICFAGLIATIPNFFYTTARDAGDARREIARAERDGRTPRPEAVKVSQTWPSWMPSSVVKLGLDLLGGSHFLLELKTEQIIERRIQIVKDGLGDALRAKEVRRYRTKTSADGLSTEVMIPKPEDVERAGEALRGLAQPISTGVFGATAPDLQVELLPDGKTYRLTFTSEAIGAMGISSVDAAIEVLRYRVDPDGTTEPTIVRQGEKRILLQLPGKQLSDDELAALLVEAKLEFHMVAEGRPGVSPSRVKTVPYDAKLNPELSGQTLSIFKKVEITGSNLVEATQTFDSRSGEIGVSIRFDTEGGRAFRRLSAQVGQRFAMVLDGKVLSAPVFITQINDGRAFISGSFTVESAKRLAINLSSGSLPAAVSVVEKSVVGPEIGKDSISAGSTAAIIGFAGVMIYMFLSYGWFGAMANLALLLNVMLIFGALSFLGATLTLPGIAGVVLTIGMAVDANVLVFERIREELAAGRKPASAIETGYSRAFSAIIDANITTLIAAALLFLFGSGPIRGFAVTLGIGIVTSVFTAVMLTRFFVASWFGWRRPKTIEL
ncbi:MAG: protein translocase subunit SecD [Neomegalonema sp.]|nr:protein translocase subunit SecD [Neomegalonema sp.]